MSLNVSAVKGYIDANEKSLIGKALVGGKTAKVINLQTGVKGSAYLNLLTTDADLQEGSCGWENKGTSTITRREIKTGQVKVNMSFCDKDLIGTALQYDVKVAVGQKTLPFEQEFVDNTIRDIQKKLEETIWKGDTVSGANHLLRFDGFIKLIDASAGVVDAGTTLDIIVEPIKAIKEVVANFPYAIMDRSDKVIFVGYDVFNAYVLKLQESNLYHYTADLDGQMDIVIPGTNIRLIGVAGLIGQDRIYGSYLENFNLGTDLEGDAEKFMFWYSEDNSEFRLKVEFNAGVQVAFPDLIVSYKGV